MTTLASVPACLTAHEVADRLKLGLSTVYDLVTAGQLEAFRLRTNRNSTRGSIRITAASVAAYLERSRVRSAR